MGGWYPSNNPSPGSDDEVPVVTNIANKNIFKCFIQQFAALPEVSASHRDLRRSSLILLFRYSHSNIATRRSSANASRVGDVKTQSGKENLLTVILD